MFGGDAVLVFEGAEEVRVVGKAATRVDFRHRIALLYELF